MSKIQFSSITRGTKQCVNLNVCFTNSHGKPIFDLLSQYAAIYIYFVGNYFLVRGRS